ncbi:MAG: LPS export ABC transporter periplasmic protein LptC [Bacteroidales bacterium]|nr:LPS export ABC transporter periplasmic protein LptC [Bacteroidales bacterium]
MKSISLSIIMLSMMMLFACSNDMETVSVIKEEEELPVDIAKDVNITYSDSGKIKMRMSTDLMETYEGESPHIEMPKGIHVKFYDSEGNVKSTLTANYAISHEKTQIMEARNNVVVINANDEKLNTEHLIWNQKKNKIISDEFVKITTENKILFGEGLEADEQMNNYTILKPKGTIYLDEDFRAEEKSKKDSLPSR